MAPEGGGEVWAAGDAYEPYVGRWSRTVAQAFVEWLDVPPGARWVEVGCGTGALTEAVVLHAEPASVRAIDPSEGYVAHARERVRDERVEFEAGNALALPVPDGNADALVSGLVLNFIPDLPRALNEMVRATRSGGTVAAYVWDYAGRMELMRHFWEAAAELDSAAKELDEGRRFPICRPGPLQGAFESAGLLDVEVRSIDVPTPFRDFDDYWQPFLGGQGPAPGYCVSLSEEKRQALRERLRERLPVEADGSIHLTARAWAVRGTR